MQHDLFVVQLSKEAWARHSEQAHLIAFKELSDAKMERIDFALVVQENDSILGYVTCREHDYSTLYWQFGGAFPGTRSTSLSFKGYLALVNWSRERYKIVTTLIENTNLVMIKMALKVGFIIHGVRCVRGKVYLELYCEF